MNVYSNTFVFVVRYMHSPKFITSRKSLKLGPTNTDDLINSTLSTEARQKHKEAIVKFVKNMSCDF